MLVEDSFLKFICPISVLLILVFSCETRPPSQHVLQKQQVIMLFEADTTPPKPALPRDTSYLEHVFYGYDLANLWEMDSSITINLRYADTNNFLHVNFYDGLRHAYLTCDMAISICNAQQHLRQHDSTLSLLIYDAARPLHLQQAMWDSLDLSPNEKRKYLTPPEITSLHNYGCAVDLTICRNGTPLDMGTTYDQFDSLSQPRHEKLFMKNGRLSQEAVENRRLLRHVMFTVGLKDIPTEWWHYSYCTRDEAREKYPLIH